MAEKATVDRVVVRAMKTVEPSRTSYSGSIYNYGLELGWDGQTHDALLHAFQSCIGEKAWLCLYAGETMLKEIGRSYAWTPIRVVEAESMLREAAPYLDKKHVGQIRDVLLAVTWSGYEPNKKYVVLDIML